MEEHNLQIQTDKIWYSQIIRETYDFLCFSLALMHFSWPLSMLEAQVVSMFSVQKLSFTEKGMPSRGPRGLPYKKTHRALLFRENYYSAMKDLYTLCDTHEHTHTCAEPVVCSLCLLHSCLLCNGDKCIQVTCPLYLVDAFSAELSGRHPPIPQCQGHLQ